MGNNTLPKAADREEADLASPYGRQAQLQESAKVQKWVYAGIVGAITAIGGTLSVMGGSTASQYAQGFDRWRQNQQEKLSKILEGKQERSRFITALGSENHDLHEQAKVLHHRVRNYVKNIGGDREKMYKAMEEMTFVTQSEIDGFNESAALHNEEMREVGLGLPEVPLIELDAEERAKIPALNFLALQRENKDLHGQAKALSQRVLNCVQDIGREQGGTYKTVEQMGAVTQYGLHQFNEGAALHNKNVRRFPELGLEEVPLIELNEEELAKIPLMNTFLSGR